MVEFGTFEEAAKRHARDILACCVSASEGAFHRALAAGLTLPNATESSGLEEETAELLASTLTSLRERSQFSFVDKNDSMTRVCMNMLAHLATRDEHRPWMRSMAAA